MAELFSQSKLYKKDGTEVSASERLGGKLTGLYFSAHWCPSCRQFTPLLAQFHALLKRDAEPFEVVFVSRDRSYQAQKDYMNESHGDWLHLRQGDPLVQRLLDAYKIKTIPAMVVIDSKGGVISATGRHDVYSGLIAFSKWRQAIPTAPPPILQR